MSSEDTGQGRDRPVKAAEITPQMIEAGARELSGFDWERDSGYEVVESIYRAMWAASPLASRVAKPEE